MHVNPYKIAEFPNNPVREWRIGKFEVTRELMDEYPIELFRHFLVVGVQEVDYFHSFIFTAFSPLFDQVSEGIITPFYDVCMDVDFNVTIHKMPSREESVLLGRIKELEDELNRERNKQKVLYNFLPKSFLKSFHK